jgi:F0F1-type ATP synthase assembly protein I
MLDNLLQWETVGMIVVLILGTYAGVKTIDRLFENLNKKKKNSIF